MRPVSVACTKDNKLWLLDQGLRAAACIDLSLKSLSFQTGDPEQNLPSPIQICHGPQDRVYFTDSSLEKIFSIDKKGNTQIFADTVKFKQPTGIAWNTSKRLCYVAETGRHRILVLDESGDIINTFGTRGTKKGQFNYPTYLWTDKQGLLYVVDAMNFRVQIFSESGEIISVFGQAGNSSGYIARPKGIATDSDGNIYLVDALFHTVQIFDRSGNYLYHFGKQGNDDSEFWLPGGIFVDHDDRIFVADSYNSRIQVFQYTSGMMNDH